MLIYKNSLMFVSDYKNTIEYAKEEGREIGRAEGREMERIAIVKKMLASGMTAEQISELTQIPIEQVKQLFDED